MRSTRPRSYTHTNPPETVIWVGARTRRARQRDRGGARAAPLARIANRSIDWSTLSVTQAEPAATVSALGEGPTGACGVRLPRAGVDAHQPPAAAAPRRSPRSSRPCPGAPSPARPGGVVTHGACPTSGRSATAAHPPASQTPSAPTASRYGRPAGGSGTGAPTRRPGRGVDGDQRAEQAAAGLHRAPERARRRRRSPRGRPGARPASAARGHASVGGGCGRRHAGAARTVRPPSSMCSPAPAPQPARARPPRRRARRPGGPHARRVLGRGAAAQLDRDLRAALGPVGDAERPAQHARLRGGDREPEADAVTARGVAGREPLRRPLQDLGAESRARSR